MRRVVVVAMICSVAAAACQLIAGIHDDTYSYTPEAAPPPPTPDAEIIVVEDAAPSCTLGTIPSRPIDLVDTHPTNGKPIVFAVSTIGIAGVDDPDGSTTPPGFNLDQRCTCQVVADSVDGGSAPSCVPPPNPLSPNPCDLPNGVDNGLKNIGDALKSFGAFDHLGDNVQCGSQNILFVLNDYGGGTEDSTVSVIGVSSVGTEGYTDGTNSLADASCGHPPPRLDGTDVWLAEFPFPGASGSLTNPTFPVPTLGDPRGFVQKRRLYASVTGQPYSFRLKVLGAEVEIASPTLTGHLVPLDASGNVLPDDTTEEPARYRVDDGLIGGRVRATDMLKALASTLCNTPPQGPILYEILHGPLCQARDLASDEGLDNKDVPCTDLSVAFRFTAHQANIGSVADAAPPLPPSSCDANCNP